MLKNARTPLGQAIAAFAKSVQDRLVQEVEEVVPSDEPQKRVGLGRLL
jgi:hypothetical protein